MSLDKAKMHIFTYSRHHYMAFLFVDAVLSELQNAIRQWIPTANITMYQCLLEFVVQCDDFLTLRHRRIDTNRIAIRSAMFIGTAH